MYLFIYLFIYLFYLFILVLYFLEPSIEILASSIFVLSGLFQNGKRWVGGHRIFSRPKSMLIFIIYTAIVTIWFPFLYLPVAAFNIPYSPG